VPLGDNNKITGQAGENLTLVKGVPTTMGRYDVTYESDSMHPRKSLWYYKLHFAKKGGGEEFTLMPNAFVNYKGNQGLMANPDARHYWDHDIFTYITSLPDPDKTKDTATFHTYTSSIGDTIFYSNGYVTVDTIVLNPSNNKYHFQGGDTALMASLTVHSKEGPSYKAAPVFRVQNNSPVMIMDSVVSQNLVFAFTGFENAKKIKLDVKESNALMSYITLKAYNFPLINLVWAGFLIMVTGIIVSIVRRAGRSRSSLQNLTF
jgi:cytochrome c-type biogenesis protein CcmF